MATSSNIRHLVRERDPRDVGERVLAGLDAGRDKINAFQARQARATRDIIRVYAERDAAAGYPARGRAARIAKLLEPKGISRSTVYRHASQIPALFCTGQNT